MYKRQEYVLAGRELDYLIINHMEPDHGASIEEILMRYPGVQIVCTAKAAVMMKQFGFRAENVMEVGEGDTLSFGKHQAMFVTAPMVHWPEAMVTFDTTSGVLFSADAFGSFGSLDGKLFADEVHFERDWLDDARRYYTNIVGKYGPQVQKLLKKAAGLDIKYICPLHGPVWRENLGFIVDKYQKWSGYEPEEKGVMIAYASMYGNTESAANILAAMLCERGMTNIVPVSYTHLDVFLEKILSLPQSKGRFLAAQTADERTLDFVDTVKIVSQNAFVGFKTVLLCIEVEKLMQIPKELIVGQTEMYVHSKDTHQSGVCHIC